MKKFLMLLVAVAGLFILAGCTESPKDVATEWAAAIAIGDVETANEYSTENTHVLNALVIASLEDDIEKQAEFLEGAAELEDGEVKISDDGNTAVIYVDGKPAVNLTKVDGEWKVDVKK
jgi:putative sterol carrier protein